MKQAVSKLMKIKTRSIFMLMLMAVFITSATTSDAQETLTMQIPDSVDSKILVVTNRDYTTLDSNQLVFEPRLDENLEFSYVNSYYSQDNWSFDKKQSLHELFEGQFDYDDWVVFVHGDGKTLLSAVDRAREIQELHRVNILVYSWPSKDPELGGIKNFKNSYANVEKSAGKFHQFIEMLYDLKVSDENPFIGDNLSLFLHSLGNYYLVRLHQDSLLFQHKTEVFDNLIINAAAVESKDHNLWLESLDISKRIYVNSNDDDISLSGLRLLTKLGRQLGERPESPFASNAIYVNFTQAVGFPGSMGPSHSYYFASITDRSANIKAYYTTIFHGKEAQLMNDELFSYLPKEDSFFIKF